MERRLYQHEVPVLNLSRRLLLLRRVIFIFFAICGWG